MEFTRKTIPKHSSKLEMATNQGGISIHGYTQDLLEIAARPPYCLQIKDNLM